MERLPRSCLSFRMPFFHVGRVPENNGGNDRAQAIWSSPHETFKSYATGETKRDILKKTRLCTTFRHSPKTYQSSAVRPAAPSVSRLLPA